MVHLDPFIARSLAARVKPFEPSEWIPDAVVDVKYVVLGLPTELLSTERIRDVVRTKLEATLVRMDACEEPPEMRKDFKRRYAKLAEASADDAIQDMDGMSGAPVFAFRIEGERVRYWLAGVQSSWHRQLRVVAFCPVREFFVALVERVRQLEGEGAR